ncbi:MAG: hypothetical protein LBB23_04340 [Rickettsiales bacterium]|jgi:DNA repair protein RadC|nr:hypothetical protein [Rickettsiales bacterium]
MSGWREGHRKRIFDKFDKGLDMSPYEILEIILCYCIPRMDVRGTASQLVKKYGSPLAACIQSEKSLLENEGIGISSARLLRAIGGLYEDSFAINMKAEPIYHNIQILYDYCRIKMAALEEERVLVLYLDANMKLIKSEEHTKGSAAESALYKDKIAKNALVMGARNVVVVHNHPAGGDFSIDDYNVSCALRDALGTIDVKLFDHLLVSDGRVLSAKEKWPELGV